MQLYAAPVDETEAAMYTQLHDAYARWYTVLQAAPESTELCVLVERAISNPVARVALCDGSVEFGSVCPDFLDTAYDTKQPLPLSFAQVIEQIDDEGRGNILQALIEIYRISVLIKIYKIQPAIKDVVRYALDIKSQNKMSSVSSVRSAFEAMVAKRSVRHTLRKLMSTDEALMDELTTSMKYILRTFTGTQTKYAKVYDMIDQVTDAKTLDSLELPSELNGLFESLNLDELKSASDPVTAAQSMAENLLKNDKIRKQLRNLRNNPEILEFMKAFNVSPMQ